MPVAAHDRQTVKERAGFRCEYCHIVGWELQVDHIVPLSPRRDTPTKGARRDLVASSDLDALDNLAAACAHCNRLKGNFTHARDPVSGFTVRLFHPRRDSWEDHFGWSDDFQRMLPVSAIGGATIARLRMNAAVVQGQRRLLHAAAEVGITRWP